MELTKKKEIIIAAIVAVVIVAIIIVLIAAGKKGSVPSAVSGVANNNSQSTSTAFPSTYVPASIPTHLPAPTNVTVPDAGAKNVAPGVAVPQVEAAASPSGDNKYRSFSIIMENGEFMPNTIAVNLGDIVNLEIGAIGANYDFTQPDYSISVPIPAGGNVRKQFQANVTGKFVFYCSTCGGPAKGPLGYLIVTGQ